ncbi:hypothetical protein NMG29_20440 [Streptomyces cocklensis]|jgi:hypothetical protein|uniref:Uncharacterized protein n=1 Tax=Actinacidiphila cocklensis TaxID=887465 RepID=A0A9W4GQT4_9ACTN|nr:hypothetical protein [Actinacidiphila cocklensis]MDD1060546.1 hypothetical protein [Actinacidiphila cocklensis]WSX73925.1 hypothetical protein OH826_08660 [Streptomyces sp. NBC_00899]WSX80010.1 hypothetical protein OH826_42850 [Streptomyces sp. NBC_00899]CAG6393949.1 conserved exported hypothetical protein [Actinacidiphila cocklensis]
MRSITRISAVGGSVLALAVSGLIVGVSAGTAHASTCSHAYLPLPDSSCTPGVYYSAVTQSTIHSTICVSGWTATVRPPTTYTNPLKAQGIIDYGYADTSMSSYEEDHLVPLELGGSPRDPGNLWPEPYSGTKTAYTKDGTETKLKNAVCNGTITLSAARSAIKNNWTTALQVTGIG